jgi:S-adenosylhomocysteine hydrolase
MKLNALQIGEGAVQLNEALDAMLDNKIKARAEIAQDFENIKTAQAKAMDVATNVAIATLETLDAEIKALKEAIGTDDGIAKAA